MENAPAAAAPGAAGNVLLPTSGDAAKQERAKVAARIKRKQLKAKTLAEVGLDTTLSTTGGTSDGRFIAKICSQLIEFGPVNATSHKIDERVALNSIEPLKNIYRRALEKLIA